MIPYAVEYTDTALKQLKKLDKATASMIISFIDKKLDGCSDPRAHGRSLTANHSGKWRYRVGDYRLLCMIEDNRIIITVVAVGHRKEIYD